NHREIKKSYLGNAGISSAIMSSRRGLILSDGSTWSRSSSITTATTTTRDSDYRQDNSKNISFSHQCSNWLKKKQATS
ncbi:unnamed protein product, partial [Brassica rapa subsp. narinosa]